MPPKRSRQINNFIPIPPAEYKSNIINNAEENINPYELLHQITELNNQKRAYEQDIAEFQQYIGDLELQYQKCQNNSNAQQRVEQQLRQQLQELSDNSSLTINRYNQINQQLEAVQLEIST